MTSVALAQGIVYIIGIFLALGLIFAVLFVTFGAGKIDPAAAKGTIGFRLIILPGAIVLWPWLAIRWWRAALPPQQRNAEL